MSNTQSKYFYSSAKTENGMSGGPIARTSDNKIVGIVKGRLDEDINKTYGVRITQQIIDLINQLRG